MNKIDYYSILRRAFSDAFAVQADMLEKDFAALGKELEQLQGRKNSIDQKFRDINYALLFNSCKYDVLAGKLEITDKASYDRSMGERALIEQDGAKTEQQQKDIQSEIQQNRFRFFQYQSCLESESCSKCDFPCSQMELVETFCDSSDYISSLDYPTDKALSQDLLFLNMHYSIAVGPCNKINLKKIKIKPPVKAETKEETGEVAFNHIPFLCAINPDRSENKELQDKFIDFLKTCFTEYLFLLDEDKALFSLGFALHGIIEKFNLEYEMLNPRKDNTTDTIAFSEYAVEALKDVYKIMSEGRTSITDYATYKESKERLINQSVGRWRQSYAKFIEKYAY